MRREETRFDDLAPVGLRHGIDHSVEKVRSVRRTGKFLVDDPDRHQARHRAAGFLFYLAQGRLFGRFAAPLAAAGEVPPIGAVTVPHQQHPPVEIAGNDAHPHSRPSADPAPVVAQTVPDFQRLPV